MFFEEVDEAVGGGVVILTGLLGDFGAHFSGECEAGRPFAKCGFGETGGLGFAFLEDGLAGGPMEGVGASDEFVDEVHALGGGGGDETA